MWQKWGSSNRNDSCLNRNMALHQHQHWHTLLCYWRSRLRQVNLQTPCSFFLFYVSWLHIHHIGVDHWQLLLCMFNLLIVKSSNIWPNMVVVSYLLCLFFVLFPGCPGTYHPNSVPLCPMGVVFLFSVPVSHSGAQYPPSSTTKYEQSQIIKCSRSLHLYISSKNTVQIQQYFAIVKYYYN